MRNVQVSVSWTDRNNEAQTVSFASVISKTDPSDVGSLGFPLPANTVLKQPKNRNINIPVPAIDLGNGQSAVQMVSTFAAVFSNETGYVVKTCNRIVTTASDLGVGCTDTTAYILAGYISMRGSGSPGFPTGLVPNTEQITGATGVTCSLNDAVDQNNNATISGYKYYLCVVTVASAASGWSGTLRMAGAGLSTGTNYLVCRFQYPTESGVTANQRNVQRYESVAESLDSQNYLITTSSSCPIVNSLATVQHQNCSSSSVSPAQRLLNCPAN